MKSNTPIYDFLSDYAKKNAVRAHMPGHKGQSPFDRCGVSKYDITEIEGADVLYSSHGIIRESEELSASLFGAGRTLYSTEGSSLSIRAMLYLLSLYAQKFGKKRIIAAGRNAHISFVNSCALLDFDVKWLYPESSQSVISCKITPEELDAFLLNMKEKPCAVYITSPDYLGNIADIEGLSRVCKKHSVLLLVDNAHGAYLAFLEGSPHPIRQGCDMCCDSAHKTLPALTGGAYLHISEEAPKMFAENAERAMALFASTSPSYLILASLDLLRANINSEYYKKLSDFTIKLEGLKQFVSGIGLKLVGNEKLKLTLSPKSFGYTGTEPAKALSLQNVFCEFADPDFVVLMFSPENSDADLFKVKVAFENLERRAEILTAPPALPRPKSVMSMKEALFSNSHEIPTSDALGEVLASAEISCPPAVSLAVAGEVIDNEVLNSMEYYGIKKCRVVIK